jgi:hypothetical protein
MENTQEFREGLAAGIEVALGQMWTPFDEAWPPLNEVVVGLWRQRGKYPAFKSILFVLEDNQGNDIISDLEFTDMNGNSLPRPDFWTRLPHTQMQPIR